MTNPQILRIAGLELAEAHGDAPFADGDHQVEAAVSLRLTGSVQQLPLQLVTPTITVPLAAVLGLVAQRLQIPADRLYDVVLAAANDALHAEAEEPGPYVLAAQNALDQAKAAAKTERKKQEKRGPLRRIVTVSHVRVRGPNA